MLGGFSSNLFVFCVTRLMSCLVLLILAHVLPVATLTEDLIDPVDICNQCVSKLIELFVILTDPLFLPGVKSVIGSVRTWILIRKRVSVFTECLFKLLECSNDFILHVFWTEF